jgi:hypothetical protein
VTTPTRRERAWLVTLDGYPTVSTNDLTLDEVEVVERVCGVPYSLLNPLASVKVAKALFVVLAMRAGETEDAAVARLGKLSLRALHSAFTFDPGTDGPPPATAAEVADPPSSAPTSAIG